jgi:hypothetical protein
MESPSKGAWWRARAAKSRGTAVDSAETKIAQIYASLSAAKRVGGAGLGGARRATSERGANGTTKTAVPPHCLNKQPPLCLSPRVWPTDRFDVYVCTAAERQYALEVWRLLDTAQRIIPVNTRSKRIINVPGGRKKQLLKCVSVV